VPPPAAQSGTTPAPPAGVAPNTQTAPLLRSGVPAPTPQQARPIAPAAAGAGISPQSAQGQPLRRMEECLFNDPGMGMLVDKDETYRNALGAESPSDLVLRLLPSDGHLD
jgi:hypothetical protein